MLCGMHRIYLSHFSLTYRAHINVAAFNLTQEMKPYTVLLTRVANLSNSKQFLESGQVNSGDDWWLSLVLTAMALSNESNFMTFQLFLHGHCIHWSDNEIVRQVDSRKVSNTILPPLTYDPELTGREISRSCQPQHLNSRSRFKSSRLRLLQPRRGRDQWYKVQIEGRHYGLDDQHDQESSSGIPRLHRNHSRNW